MYNVTPTEQVSQSFARVDRHWPNHRRQLLGMHMFARSGYFSFSRTLEIHWTKVYTVQILSIPFILNTVLQLYYYSMLYYIKNGMNKVIFLFLMLLFLKILYNKTLYIMY